MLAMYYGNQKGVDDWKHTRAMTYMMARLWGDPKTVPREITEFMPLPGDPEGFDLESFDIEKEFATLRAQGWNV